MKKLMVYAGLVSLLGFSNCGDPKPENTLTNSEILMLLNEFFSIPDMATFNYGFISQKDSTNTLFPKPKQFEIQDEWGREISFMLFGPKNKDTVTNAVVLGYKGSVYGVPSITSSKDKEGRLYFDCVSNFIDEKDRKGIEKYIQTKIGDSTLSVSFIDSKYRNYF